MLYIYCQVTSLENCLYRNCNLNNILLINQLFLISTALPNINIVRIHCLVYIDPLAQLILFLRTKIARNFNALFSRLMCTD